MKKRLIALLLATTVIASGCGAEDDPDEENVEIGESDEESEDESNDGSKFYGRFTNGLTTLTFSGDELTYSSASMEFTVNYKIEYDEIIYDVDTLELTDAYMDYYEEYSKDHFSSGTDGYLESLKLSYDSPEKINYNEEDKTLKFQLKTFYCVEDYNIGPNGEFTCEEDDITITFEDGEATFNNAGNKETFPYICYIEDGKVCIGFDGIGYMETEFYKKYNEQIIEFENVDEIVIKDSTFKR